MAKRIQLCIKKWILEKIQNEIQYAIIIIIIIIIVNMVVCFVYFRLIL
jgi:hypothetical protein